MKKDAKIPFERWFDPRNEEHMKAYLHLEKLGVWPEGFVPDNVDRGENWYFRMISKMADAWVLHFQAQQILKEEKPFK